MHSQQQSKGPVWHDQENLCGIPSPQPSYCWTDIIQKCNVCLYKDCPTNQLQNGRGTVSCADPVRGEIFLLMGFELIPLPGYHADRLWYIWRFSKEGPKCWWSGLLLEWKFHQVLFFLHLPLQWWGTHQSNGPGHSEYDIVDLKNVLPFPFHY